MEKGRGRGRGMGWASVGCKLADMRDKPLDQSDNAPLLNGQAPDPGQLMDKNTGRL